MRRDEYAISFFWQKNIKTKKIKNNKVRMAPKLTDSKWHEIYVHVLPRAWRCSVHFMHDAKMGMLVYGAVPPVPSLAMYRTASESLQALDGFPVREHDARRACGCLCEQACGSTEDCREGLDREREVV